MGCVISRLARWLLLLMSSTERINFLGYGLSSRKGKHFTALWVKPPPQGFSQARCSSKIWTLCPARASCSPHIAPEGPPPTIAISAMVLSRSDGLKARPWTRKTAGGGWVWQSIFLGNGPHQVVGKTTRQNPARSIAPKRAVAKGEAVTSRTTFIAHLCSTQNSPK